MNERTMRKLLRLADEIENSELMSDVREANEVLQGCYDSGMTKQEVEKIIADASSPTLTNILKKYGRKP
jgi:hypothetical protein